MSYSSDVVADLQLIKLKENQMAKRIPLDRLREISKYRPLRANVIHHAYAQTDQVEGPEGLPNEFPATGSLCL